MSTGQSYVGKGTFAPFPEQTAKNRPPIRLLAQSQRSISTDLKFERHTADDQPAAPMPLTPFQAALLFIQHKQHTHNKPAAYAAFFEGGRLLSVEWLHNQRGHNPTVNTDRVVRRAKHHSATHVMLATWVRSTQEHPYAVEFQDEVIVQHSVLTDRGLAVMDSLRLSETGMYSYYASQQGPYSGGDAFHGINAYYYR